MRDPGPEFDAWLAERFLGWLVPYKHGKDCGFAGQSDCGWFHDGAHLFGAPASFSTYDADAITYIWAELVRRSVAPILSSTIRAHRVSRWGPGDMRVITHAQPTVALAICRAAEAVVEEEER